MSAYYNENDPFAAAWLVELMKDGLIADGWVDTRSIEDVTPNELKGFTQCHFFAGIGVWSLALRVAGWPDERPVWTGSAPCQPFSAAGKGGGYDDERHLWPAWFHLIAHGKRHDIPVLGEQVAAKAGRAWFDLVSSDMEALDHGCGAIDTSAAGFGAPFIGQRLYWLASSHSSRLERHGQPGQLDAASGRQVASGYGAKAGALYGLATSSSLGSGVRSEMGRTSSEDQSGTEQRQRFRDEFINGRDDNRTTSQSNRYSDRIPLHPVEYWRDADWLLCRDPNGARFRPVEPGTFPLVDARAFRNRLAAVRGAGNALNVSQASTFCEVAMNYLDGVPCQ